MASQLHGTPIIHGLVMEELESNCKLYQEYNSVGRDFSRVEGTAKIVIDTITQCFGLILLILG